MRTNLWGNAERFYHKRLSILAALFLLFIAPIVAARALLPYSSSRSQPDITWINGAHAGGVGKAALSPDGQTLATADYAEIELWRYSDGQLLGTIGMAGVDMVKCLKFTPDGQYIVGSGTSIPGYPGNPSTLRVWRVSDRSLVRAFDLHQTVGSFALSPDSHYLVANYAPESVVLLDFNTGAILQTSATFAATMVAISPDSSIYAATGADHFGDPPTVNVWRISDGTLITKLTGLSFLSDSIAFSPNGQYLAAGDWGGNGTHGKVLVWQIPGFTQVQNLTTPFTSSIYSLAFSPDSQSIAAAGVDDTIWIWHLADGALTQSFYSDFNNAIWNIIFSDNSTIFAGGARNVSKVLRASDGAILREIGGNREFVTSVAFSPDGNFFAVDNGSVGAGGNFWVQLFRSDTGAGVRAFPIHNDIINSVAFSPDGQFLASASGSQPPDTVDTRIFIARVSNGLAQLTLAGHAGGTTSVAFSPDSQILASGGRDNVLALWRVADGSLLRFVRGHANWIHSVAFSPDGQMIASCSGDSTVKLWRVSDLSLIRTIPGNGYPVNSISISPDGQTLALTALNTVQLWRISDAALLRTMYVEADAANLGQVVFSRDGSVVISANRSYPPTVRFWRASDGVVLGTYTQETGWVQPPALAVSPDNTKLGIGRYDSIVEMARYPITNASAYIPVYEGTDDLTDCNRIAGWAWDTNQPYGIANVDIYDGQTFLATVPANQFRQDLLLAGEGDGYHSFIYTIPASLKNGATHTLSVKFSGTNVELASSPRSITCNAPTAAPARISGRVLTSDGAPLGGVLMQLGGATASRAITDENGYYSLEGLSVNSFYTITPRFANYSFTPRERSLSLVADRTDAIFTATAQLAQTENPLDTAEYFVRQQYLDFLGREPDAGGLLYWSSRIAECGADSRCAHERRIEVSAAFFMSEEFQETGSFVYSLYRAGLGRQPRYAEFLADRVGVLASDDINARRLALASRFVARQEFTQKYAAAATAETFVAALIESLSESSGVDLSAQRDSLLARYYAGKSMTESRSLVLMKAAESEQFKRAEYNRAFVLMQYFGYLKRDPDVRGYDFWLNVLNNRVPGNYRSMVCAFITSAEYQRRFSSVVTRSNSQCG